MKYLEVITIIMEDIKSSIATAGTTNLMSRNNNIKGTITRAEPKPLNPNTVKAKNTIILDNIITEINMMDRMGFEPIASALQGQRSTVDLPARDI